MKKIFSILLSIAMILGITSCGFAAEEFVMTMQIDNPVMTVNGADQEIDPGRGTVPVVENERTLVPIRAIIEAMGGTVEWDGDTSTTTLTIGDDVARLTIDSTTAYFNDKAETLDTAPMVINERTMLPIRFIAESFKFDVDWNGDEQLITITKAVTIEPTETAAPADTQANDGSDAEQDTGNNILIAYFSRAGENWEVGYVDKGNTAVIADYISEEIEADIFEITPVVPYPEAYYDTLPIVQRERDNNERPEFNGSIENFAQYDTVFLGYPIWYGGLPMIMYTFLEEYDMSGKTVIPFSTHGGSGWGSTRSELNTLCPNANFIDGFSTAGTNARNAQSDVEKWLEGIELPKKEVMTEEDKVLAAFEKIQQSMIDKDMETLDHMTKDDKTFTHMSGKTQTKEEFFGEIEDGTLNYYAYDIKNLVITIDGNYANLKASTTLTAKVYGSSGSWTLNTDMWFEKINGEWIQCNKPSELNEAGL